MKKNTFIRTYTPLLIILLMALTVLIGEYVKGVEENHYTQQNALHTSIYSTAEEIVSDMMTLTSQATSLDVSDTTPPSPTPTPKPSEIQIIEGSITTSIGKYEEVPNYLEFQVSTISSRGMFLPPIIGSDSKEKTVTPTPQPLGIGYIDAIIIYKNISTEELDCRSLANVTFGLGKENTYGNPKTVIEKEGKYSLFQDSDEIFYMRPLDTCIVHYIFEVPDSDMMNNDNDVLMFEIIFEEIVYKLKVQ